MRLENNFTISVQIDPPQEKNFEKLRKDVSDLKDSDVTIFDINDSRRDCMDSFSVAANLSNLDKDGATFIPHITRRDLSLETLLPHIAREYTEHNLRNILVVTGDPYPERDPEIKTKSIGMIASIDRYLRQTGITPDLIIAGAVNQNSANLNREANKLRAKIREHADFFMSQPVFDQEQAQDMHNFCREHSDKPILAGVWPLASMKTVENIKKGVIEGVVIPPGIYDEAQLYQNDPDRLKAWSFEQTRQTVKYIRDNNLAQGIYVVAPLRDPAQLVDFVKSLNN